MKKKSLKVNGILSLVKQLCALLFPLITYPYVLRVLGATNVGKVSFSSSVMSYFSLIAAFGIGNYAIREGARIREDKAKIENFVDQMFTINCYFTFFAYTLLIVLYTIWAKLHNYTGLILIQSLAMIFTTIGIDWFYQIYEDFYYITVRAIAVNIISIILMFLLVRNPDDYIVYAGITVIANGGANIFNFIHAQKFVKIRFVWRVDFKKHIIPMVILFCNNVVITVYVNSDVTMLGIMKTDQVVGIYNVSVRIYSIIKSLVSSLIVVTLPRLSMMVSKGQKEEYYVLTNKLLNVLLSLVLPAIIGLYMISENAIIIIGGKEFLGGVTALRILSVALMFSVTASFCTTSILLPNRREKNILMATVISSILNVVLNLLFIPAFSLNGAAFTTLLAELSVTILAGYSARRHFHFAIKIKDLILVAIGCSGIVIACLQLNGQFSSVIIDTVAKIIVSAFVYGTVLLIGHHSLAIPMARTVISKIKSK